jgi:hypothetical protein
LSRLTSVMQSLPADQPELVVLWHGEIPTH